MATEHERKFLLCNDGWRDAVRDSTHMVQGYLPGQRQCSVRVRVCNGNSAFLNIKSATVGVSRQEFEYPLPLQDAQQLLRTLCATPLLERTRHHVPWGDFLWEIDEFAGASKGLIVAELELRTPQQPFVRPPWLGREVSHDVRYYNTRLQHTPWRQW